MSCFFQKGTATTESMRTGKLVWSWLTTLPPGDSQWSSYSCWVYSPLPKIKVAARVLLWILPFRTFQTSSKQNGRKLCDRTATVIGTKTPCGHIKLARLCSTLTLMLHAIVLTLLPFKFEMLVVAHMGNVVSSVRCCVHMHHVTNNMQMTPNWAQVLIC